MEPYRQVIRDISLAIERATSRLPDDRYYYVLLRGEIQGRHRTLRQAQMQYKEILRQQNWKPEPVAKKPVDPAKEAVERYMDSLEEYWGSAHGHRHRGGKTMYRS